MMKEQRSEAMLSELRARTGDMLAALHLLTPAVEEKCSREDLGYLASVNKSIYRLVRLIHHMEMGGENSLWQPEPMDVLGLCRDAARQCEFVAQTLGVSFEWSLSDGSALTVADDKLLELAVLDLLCSAFQAVEPGGHVSLRAVLSGPRVVITVSDDGPVPDPAQGENPLLKQTERTDLEAARNIARRHGGVLMVENGEERGLRAVLSLPIQRPTREESLNADHPRVDPRGGFSALLVEFSPVLPAESYLPQELD